MPRRAYLFPILLYVLALLVYLDWSEILGNPPVADTDFATHWAETWTASKFLDDSRLWGYDPFYMAGYPGGLLYHNSARLVAILTWLLSQTGVSLALSYNLILLALLATAPLAVYPAARWLGLPESDALVAQTATLALWLFDPLIGWSWHGGAFTFLVAVPVSLLILSAAVHLTNSKQRESFLSLAVWYGVGPLAFWLHSFSFLLLLAPLTVLTIARWRGLPRRQRLHLVCWPPMVILVNLPWIIPSIQIASERGRSDFFLLGGLDALAADLFGIGLIDGASRPGLLGLRWTVIALGGYGLWRLGRARPALWSLAAGVWAGFALSYGAVHLPGGGDLQPYRYIQQAAIWSTIGLLPGARGLIASLAPGRQLRGALLSGAIAVVAVWIASGIWPARPVALGGPDRYWRGPSAESRAICEALRVEPGAGSRVIVDDWRLAAILPACSGVEVLGGHFLWFPMDYGFATATVWEYLETPYTDYDPASLQSNLDAYNVSWLLVRRWDQPGWYTLSSWLKDHPGQAERIASFEHFDLWLLDTKPDPVTVIADHQAVRVQGLPAGERLVLPYHWIDSLRAEPDRVVLEPVFVGNDPVPFIGILSPRTTVAAICLRSQCDP